MDNKHNFGFWTVFLIAALTLIPTLGLTEFTTKGEPREAVVALSMLQQHNWVLPVNNGFDIPYKPPFFQWCIALLSLPQAVLSDGGGPGLVTEFTSRLPSAIALILMLVAGYSFYARRKGPSVALLASMVTLTAFEVHRAGTNCRVDMVLTAFIVGALYLLYRWWERGCRHLPWPAILCMSGATLTKGPVGIVLPCLVTFAFVCFRPYAAAPSPGAAKAGRRLAAVGAKLALAALLACVLPALWYVAAYQQGGEPFLQLVMEENLGRFLGKMTYESHNNPWPYNLLMLASGLLPWTLPLLLSLPVLPWRRFSRAAFMESARRADTLQVFTWVAFLAILAFYCIPKSKRGVYLLPCYPFMAVLIAEYAVWLMRRSTLPVRLYVGFLTVAGTLLTATLVAVRAGAVPDSLFGGRHAYENLRMLHALADGPMGLGSVLLAVLPLAAAALGLMVLARRRVGFITQRPVLSSAVMTLLIYLAFDGYYKPTVMNTKSLRPYAEQVERLAGGTPVYAYTGINRQGGSTLRFFGIDFYLGDRVRQFDVDRPGHGTLVTPAKCRGELVNTYGKDYRLTLLDRTAHRETEFKDTIYVYRFSKRPQQRN